MGILKQEQKLKRQEYLQAILHKYTTTEPILSNQDIGVVLAMEIEDVSDFIKKYKKEIKKT